MTPIDTLINQAKFTCTCCGAPGHFNPLDERMHSDCQCHQQSMDTCPVTGRCALHCVGRRCQCKATRKHGLWWINYTGLHHFYRAGESKTLCNRTMPESQPYIVRAPMLRVRGNECKRCLKMVEGRKGK